jgi:dTDP-4-amino-4,6-dideoxy-D-galactose acyltransferase
MVYRHPDRESFYHPYNFLLPPDQAAELYRAEIHQLVINKGANSIFDSEGNSITYELLHWDTEFFGRPIYKVHYSQIAPTANGEQIDTLFKKLCRSIDEENLRAYIFFEIPSEDLETLQSVSRSGWTLIETRLTFFNNNIALLSSASRDQVRLADHNDIEDLKNTAIFSTNHFDRFHSDPFFSEEEVNRFMGVFIENSMNGREDYVVVPKYGPANAFFAGSKVLVDEGISIGRMTLSAVSPDRKGWHIHVTQGLCSYFEHSALDTAVMTTQSTNRAVLTNLWKLNFRFGKASHIFSRLPS